MNHHCKAFLLTAWAFFASAGIVWSGQYEDGVAAQGNGDYPTALGIFRPLAAQGDANSRFKLSQMYGNGQGVKADAKESLKWLRLSAQQGNAQAQSNLGVAYNRGRDVPQDFVRAYLWFSIAAASGSNEAITNVEVAQRRMTPLQISQAKEMASACVKNNFRGCN